MKVILYLQLTTTGACFDHFWVQGHKFLPETQKSELAGSFHEELGVAEYPFYLVDEGSDKKSRNKVGCDKRLFGGKVEATVVSPGGMICKNGVILSWIPPPKCTEDQIANGATHLCRTNEDIYFFLFTVGNTQGQNKFYIGQNTFGFYVSEMVD